MQRTFKDLHCSPTFEKILVESGLLLRLFHVRIRENSDHKLIRRDISFVQGMSYVAVFLRMHMNLFESFRAFSNLVITSDILHSFYMFKTVKVLSYSSASNTEDERILEDIQPLDKKSKS